MSIYPPYLIEGSKIGIWTPSSSAPFLFPNRFKRALGALENFGFFVETGNSCNYNQQYQPGFQQKLVDEFHDFIIRADIDAIVFSTGGWSSIALLPYINWELIKNNPKPIIGYSDATSFLLACYKMTGLVTFHGPMVISEWGEYESPWAYTINNFLKVVNLNESLVLTPPEYWTQENLWWDKEDNRKRKVNGKSKWTFYREGYCKGTLIGGNLTTLSLLLNTTYFPDCKNSILFIETEGYSPDKFLAFMMQLKISGYLDVISGLIVGKHSNPLKTSSGNIDFNNILNIVLDKEIPVLIDVDMGHTEPMITLPIGGEAIINSATNEFILLADRSAK